MYGISVCVCACVRVCVCASMCVCVVVCMFVCALYIRIHSYVVYIHRYVRTYVLASKCLHTVVIQR